MLNPVFESNTSLFVQTDHKRYLVLSLFYLYIYLYPSSFHVSSPRSFKSTPRTLIIDPINIHVRSSFIIATNRRSVFSHPILGKEKLGVPQSENVSVVLESDGTQVEDGEYFKTLANNTILLLLRHGERWCPTGVDIIRAGIYLIGERVIGLAYKLAINREGRLYVPLNSVESRQIGWARRFSFENRPLVDFGIYYVIFIYWLNT